ncbi:MAG: hypothetical protein M9914_08855 [Trueperaceae bacterium]|nr:hypothetical protein [Trueperaceae bacterium]
MHSTNRPLSKPTWKIGILLVLVGVALFIGYVGAAVIGAVAPGTVAFANDMACGGGTALHHSYGYSYKPGQTGVSQVFSCQLPDGTIEDVTLQTFLYAGLVFSGGAFVVLALLALTVLPALGRALRRRIGGRLDDFMAPTGVGATGAFGGLDIQGIYDRASARKAQSSSATPVFVNGKQVDLDPEAQANLYRTVASVAGAAGDRDERATAGSKADGRTVAERLEEVERLYRDGRLTRTEYDAVRTRILADL